MHVTSQEEKVCVYLNFKFNKGTCTCIHTHCRYAAKTIQVKDGELLFVFSLFLSVSISVCLSVSSN